MFWKKRPAQKRLEDHPVVQHLGVFRRSLSLWQGVALIVSSTIGAGILGLPYAVSKVGVGLGVAYILILGFLMMGLNLLIGEVAVRTNKSLQLVGLAEKYLGKVGKWAMTIVSYVTLFGVLVIYIIGEGEGLSALFGGPPLLWSTIFFTIAGFLVFFGLRTIKTAEFFLSIGVLTVIIAIAVVSAPHIAYEHIAYADLAYLLLPYGVILFAFHSTTSIPEAHALFRRDNVTFKKAIIISSLISMVAYTLFAVVVVGVSGKETTEIATIGLGASVGNVIFVLGNLFAVLAMGTSFLVGALSLRDSLHWDFKIPQFLSTIITVGVPMTIFLLGIRQFIAAIDIVGGVFISFELLFILLIYWRAKHKGDVEPSKYQLHHTLLLAVLLLLALSVGAVYSVWKLF